MASHLLKEDGGRLLLEDGSGSVLLELQPVVTGNYLVQEVDGTSRFALEDGTGFVLLEVGGPPPTPTSSAAGGFISVRRRPRQIILRDIADDDAALALTLMLRTIRRRSTK